MQNNDEKQTIFAQPWSEKNLKVEETGRPKGQIRHVIKVCKGPNCGPKLSVPLYQDLIRRLADRQDVDISYCYCLGQCTRGNNVVVNGMVMNYVTIRGLDYILRKQIERLDELHKLGLTPEELDSILFK